MITSFSGTEWSLANDPPPGVQDNSRKDSFIPSFGDALYCRYHVPIGIASVGTVPPASVSAFPQTPRYTSCPP
jgi:hypothetical protein